MNDNETLLDFLKSPDTNTRISVDNDKWLFWMTTNSITNEGEWVVYQRPPYKKNNRCLYSGHSLELALEALKGE